MLRYYQVETNRHGKHSDPHKVRTHKTQKAPFKLLQRKSDTIQEKGG